MGTEGFITAIVAIRNALETDTTGTFLEQPKKVAKLPGALGGDPIQASALRDQLRAKASPAVDKGAFFELLWAKAHFFMLPKPIVKFVKESSMVLISEETHGDDTADTHCKRSTDQGKVSITAEMHIPGASEALARVGLGLGGAATEPLAPFDPDECEILGTIYHEMTHAWLCLQEFSDEAIKDLYRAGGIAYRDSVGETEPHFDKDIAFSEAAGAYVEDRILRWCKALYGLAQVLHDPQVFKYKLQTIPDEYDKPRSDYGVVDGKKIVSPKLGDEAYRALRAAIDKKILDGRPLTLPFILTPLARLRDALWGLGP